MDRRGEYCSLNCSDAKKRFNRRGRQKNNGNYEHVERSVVIRNAGGECYLCNRELTDEYKHPHPLSISLDHVVALHNGGEHNYSNLRAVHFECNSIKRDLDLDEVLEEIEMRFVA